MEQEVALGRNWPMSSNEFVLGLSTYDSIPIELHVSSGVYHSCFSLLKDYDDPKDVEEETLQDALHYEKYCREQAAHGTRVTFKNCNQRARNPCILSDNASKL